MTAIVVCEAQVDARNVVPVWTASGAAEPNADALRPKLLDQVSCSTQALLPTNTYFKLHVVPAVCSCIWCSYYSHKLISNSASEPAALYCSVMQDGW
jgi:hypothetical protein